MLNKNDLVVLVHGLGGSRFDMWPISRRLKQTGFRIKNWGYRSVGNRIETHAERLADQPLQLDDNTGNGRIHLVTHSMGGIIKRQMLVNAKIRNLGRVIMLAPPHQGSHVARKLSRCVGWLTPSLQQLSDSVDSYVNQLPNSLNENRIEFGIIESSRDRVIVSGGGLLNGFRDHASVNGHHGVMTWHSETIDLVEKFLVHGKFTATPPQHEFVR